MSEKSIKLIPVGMYCHGALKEMKQTPEGPRLVFEKCPYWSLRPDKPDQFNGFCEYLGVGDWMLDKSGNHVGSGLLWDQVKECGIKDDIKDDD